MLNRVNRVLVTNTEADNTGTSIPTIINGDILVLNRAMGNLTGTPTITSAIDNDLIYLAQGIGAGKAILSLPIQLKGVTKVVKKAYSAPVEEVVNFGYIGSGAGTLNAALNSTEYNFIVEYKDDQRVMHMRPTKTLYSYVSDSTATLTEIATSIVRKINADRNAMVAAVMLTDGTFTALTNNATLTNESKNVTSTAHGLAVGDLVRIGGTGGTSPVYLVKTVTDANNFVLDSLYQGATATVLAANIGKITAQTLYGIQLTGQAIAYNGLDLYQKVNFVASMYTDDAYEVATISTTLDYGQGYWQQIRDAEYFAQGYLGVTNRTLFPSANLGSGTPATRAVSPNTYNVLTIEHLDSHSGDVQGRYSAPMTTMLAFYSSSAPTNSTKQTTVLAILESLFESAGVFTQ
jgi:hypothetical protein